MDVYLPVDISIGQVQSKPICKLVTYRPSNPLVTSSFSNFDWIWPIQIAKRKWTLKVWRQFQYWTPIRTLWIHMRWSMHKSCAIHCAMQQINIYLSTLFRPFLSNEFLRKWVKLKTGQQNCLLLNIRLLSNKALVSFTIMERLKVLTGSFFNMQKMSKGDYMEMDCTLCNAQPKSLYRREPFLWSRIWDLGWFWAGWPYWKKHLGPIMSKFWGCFLHVFRGKKNNLKFL